MIDAGLAVSRGGLPRHPAVARDIDSMYGRPIEEYSTRTGKAAVSINIKNEETCDLAVELAQLTGETMTGAIKAALRERLERERKERGTEARVQRLLAIGERCARMLGDGPSAAEHGDFLYDERGLPK